MLFFILNLQVLRRFLYNPAYIMCLQFGLAFKMLNHKFIHIFWFDYSLMCFNRLNIKYFMHRIGNRRVMVAR